MGWENRAARPLLRTGWWTATIISCRLLFSKTLTAKEGHKTEGFTSFFPLGLWKDYSPAKDIEAMDRDGVAISLISCTAPGVWFGDPDEARGLARELNEYGAKMASDYKGRYGLLAVLPIPRVDESLKEIEYAFDTLNADGVGILTSYGNHWLGDPAFQPIFDELNRRKAVVYTHPIDAPCCQDLMPGINPTTLEYPTDTTRAILSLLEDTAATRYGDIRFIFSHAGGTMPSVIDRIGVGNPDTIAANLRGTPEPNSRLYHLRRFYYDTAQSTNTVQMQALKTIAGVSQIVFGTDYPFGAAPPSRCRGCASADSIPLSWRAFIRETRFVYSQSIGSLRHHGRSKPYRAKINACASCSSAAKEAWARPALPRPPVCNFRGSATALW